MLGGIQRLVGSLQQQSRFTVGVATRGHPDAHRQWQCLALPIHHAVFDRLAQTLGNDARSGCIAAWQEHQELIAAVAADRIGRSQLATQACRNAADAQVPARVPKPVVDSLEPIDVDEQHRERSVGQSAFLELAGKQVIQRSPVLGAGEGIVFCGAPELDRGVGLVRMQHGETSKFRQRRKHGLRQAMWPAGRNYQRCPSRRREPHWDDRAQRLVGGVGLARAIQANVDRIAIPSMHAHDASGQQHVLREAGGLPIRLDQQQIVAEIATADHGCCRYAGHVPGLLAQQPERSRRDFIFGDVAQPVLQAERESGACPLLA